MSKAVALRVKKGKNGNRKWAWSHLNALSLLYALVVGAFKCHFQTTPSSTTPQLPL